MSSTQLLLASVAQALDNQAGLDNFERLAQESKKYPSHVFYCRKAPAASKFAGQIFCEIHCPANLFASWPLTHNGIQYAEVERALCGQGRGWKLFRFLTNEAGARQLEQLCSATDDAQKLADHQAIMDSWSKSFTNKTF